MTTTINGTTHVETSAAQDAILATVQLSSSRESVFRALASDEVTSWWVRPGVFDTRTWEGDVRVGGTWRATGVGRNGPYVLEGDFLEVEAPAKLSHSWRAIGTPVPPTMVSYLLESIDGGTRLTLRHSGFTSPEVCESTAASWRTSFDRLAELLSLRHD